MIAITHEIQQLKYENNCLNQIVKESDDYLDKILYIKIKIDSVSNQSENLYTKLIPVLNSLEKEKISSEILPELKSITNSFVLVLDEMRKHVIYSNITSTVRLYKSKFEQFKELIFDLETIRLTDDSTTAQLLKELENI